MIRIIKIIRKIKAQAAQISLTILNDHRLITISDRLHKLGATETEVSQVRSVLGKRLKKAFADQGRNRASSWVWIRPGWAKTSWLATTPVYRSEDIPLLDETIASSPLCAHLVGA